MWRGSALANDDERGMRPYFFPLSIIDGIDCRGATTGACQVPTGRLIFTSKQDAR
jgi:hypothetical protein